MMRSSVYTIENDVDASYCSYPSIPYWNRTNNTDTKEEWGDSVKRVFNHSANKDGISLYIHLPFCESKCTFCCFNAYTTINHSVEENYVEYLINEWLLYLKIFEKKPLIKQLYIGGGSPTFFSCGNLKKIITALFSTALMDSNSVLTFEAQLNSTTSEHLITMRKLGFTNINFGIQDFNQDVQKSINSVQSFDAVQKITNSARLTGYQSISFDLLYGLPHQSRKTMIDSIYKIRELMPDRIRFFEYIHAPEKNPAQGSYEEFLPVEPEKKMFLKIFKDMLNKSGYVDVGMNQFVKKSDSWYHAFETGTLHRNMMGFTTQDTSLCIGLGVSAISDTSFATVQNERNLNDYYSAIDKQKLPVANGYFLNEDDFVLRKHILNLQCKFQTSWGNSESENTVLVQGINRIKKFENRNWLKISDNSIKIRKEGREYIRNICSAFDSRIWNLDDSKISADRKVFYGVKTS